MIEVFSLETDCGGHGTAGKGSVTAPPFDRGSVLLLYSDHLTSRSYFRLSSDVQIRLIGAKRKGREMRQRDGGVEQVSRSIFDGINLGAFFAPPPYVYPLPRQWVQPYVSAVVTGSPCTVLRCRSGTLRSHT